MAEPEPLFRSDVQAVKNHLNRLFNAVPASYAGGLLEIRAINPNRGGATAQLFDCTPDGIGAAAQFATSRNANGANIYVGVNPRKPTSPRTSAASDVDVEISFAQFVDLDTGHDCRDRLMSGRLKPCFVVSTGTKPSTRMHGYWELETPTRNMEAWTANQKALAGWFKGDSTVHNPSRIARLAGTVSYPDSKKAARGYHVERTSMEVLADNDDGIPAEAIAAVYSAASPWGDPPGETAAPLPASAPASIGNLLPASTLLRSIKTGDQWHNNVIRLVAHWIGRGWSNAEILAAAESFTLPGYTHDQTRAEVGKAIEGGRRKWSMPDEEAHVEDAAARPAPVIEATPLSSIGLTSIPPRKWIYGRELLRGFVSVLGSPGGTGKTAYTIAAGFSVVSNRPLLAMPGVKVPAHHQVHKSGKVWFYNLEDPMDEMRRRVLATMLHHKLSVEDLGDRVFVDSGRDIPLVVAIRDARGNLVAAKPVTLALINEIRRRDVAVLIVDPFVQSHHAEENRNDEMNAVMVEWAQVAHQANCAVWLVHHFRKGGQGGEADSFRGAVAIGGAARVMSTLSTMSPEEAKKLNIEDDVRRQYVRLDNAKANMSPPPGVADWYRLVGVKINNGDEDYPEGDWVQAVEAWHPPSPWADMPWSLIIDILDQLAVGPSQGEFYSGAKQAKDRWAGRVVMEIAGKSEAQAMAVLKTWFENGVLETGNYMSPTARTNLQCVSVNKVKISEMRQAFTTSDEG